MRPLLFALALSAGAFVPLFVPFQANAQWTQNQVQASPNSARSSPMAAYLSGHTTTFQFNNSQHGKINLHLAMLADGTGWFFSEPANGSTWKPQFRYIYRWWIAQNGDLCYIYSDNPERLNVGSYWTCWSNRVDSDGTPIFVSRHGEVLPTVSRIQGNTLEPMARTFLDIATRTFGPNLPTPPNPARPPPR